MVTLTGGGPPTARTTFRYLAVVTLLTVGTARAQTIDIDLRKATAPRSSMPSFSVGSDRALIYLRPEHQRDLLALQAADHFRYVRCHGIFNEEMHVVTRQADGSLTYDWTNVDRFVDQLAAAKLRPFVECGFMPEALASGKQSIFWWKGNVTPPKSIDEWGQFIQEFAKHEISQRGDDEVRQWYFEVWNEPNLDGFWTGGQEGYFKLFAATSKALKLVDPHLRVGGPSTAGMAWIPELLGYCKERQVAIDFVSSHTYAATAGFLDENGKKATTFVTDPQALVDGFARAQGDIRKSAFPNLPLFITEWGPSYSPRDPIHDSYVCAPFILEKLQQSEHLVDGMSYWTFTDQFEEAGPTPEEPFHGGFGLMNVDGVRKPAAFAYAFLAHLYDAELPVSTPRVLATKDGTNARVLLWNYEPPKADAPNVPFYQQDIPADPRPEEVLSFSGLTEGTYRVTRVGTGQHRNDVYAAYLAAGKPTAPGGHLPADLLGKLRAASSGEPEVLPDLTVGSAGTAEIKLPMRTNDVWLVSVEKK